ncbi:phage baseplate assembly protein V [Nitratireductor sp. XY-223]|uniref:phage baseplate assembly protein V n=1 Tax=Nitratireductor sp. XY-223 TaxID=2561926 RepID=UPI0010AABB1E|nr:phage baseplate assembly protein V [Nitratireductor sp. XY-223]
MQPDMTDEIATFLRSRFFGKYRGTVVQNFDMTGRGRLDVKVPAVLGDQIVTAMPCVPYAGDGVGLHLLPEPGTGVWVEFEAGDPSYPVWTGFFWADGEVPENALSTLKILKTERHTMKFDDLTGEILIENDMGASATFTVQIALDAGSSVTISPGGVTAQSTPAKVEVKAAGVSASSGGLGKVDVTPASVSINSGSMEVL